MIMTTLPVMGTSGATEGVQYALYVPLLTRSFLLGTRKAHQLRGAWPGMSSKQNRVVCILYF